MNILLCVTGSVAATVFLKVRSELLQYGPVKIVMTESACKIYKQAVGDYRTIPDLYTDEDEWKWYKVGDPILHIDLRDWADILVVAPLTANTLGKIVNGLSDNLATSIIRAWPKATETKTKPIILAPAMNTEMYNNELTAKQMNDFYNLRRSTVMSKLYGFMSISQVQFIEPVVKTLACGQEGIGAMAHAKDIAKPVQEYYNKLNNSMVKEIIE